VVEIQRPPGIAIDSIGDGLPAGAMALKVSMFQLDSGALGGFGEKPHLNFTGPGGIALQLPCWPDVPRKDDPSGRFVYKDARPFASTAVHPDVVNVASYTRLKYGFRDRDREQIVFPGFDGVESVDEERECSLNTSVDDDALPDRL
jgi:hypothetical protein